MKLHLTGEQVVRITKYLGLKYINVDFNTLRLEIDVKLEELNGVMTPNKDTNKNEDFIIPKEFVKQYVELMELMDEIMMQFEEQIEEKEEV